MMTRELVALMAALLDAAEEGSAPSPRGVVSRARTVLAEVQRQTIDRVALSITCDLCSRPVLRGGPMSFEFDSRQWVALMHEPQNRPCGHNAAPIRFAVDFFEAPLS